MRPVIVFTLFTLCAVGATFLARHNPFFWDTVQLASKHGHFFFETHFSSIILPESIDSGHVPVFGMYIAFCWSLFGKTLVVSHFAMLPFLLGIGFYLLQIGRYLLGEKRGYWLLLLCFADPVLAGQSVLVSPDIALVFFFLMGLHAVWVRPNRAWLVVAVTGLGLTSMRGMMLAFGLFIFSLCLLPASGLFTRNRQPRFLTFFKKMLPFIPGGLLALAFLLYHWQQTGWIGHHPDSPWAPSFARVGIQGFLKNIAVLGWRLLDFGRVFEVLLLLYFAKRFLKKEQRLGALLLLAALVFLATIPAQMLYKGLLAHRYFLPFFICMHLITGYLLFGNGQDQSRIPLLKKVLAGVVMIGLVTGNFWIYPKKISQGWDSTLGHWPWYGMVAEAQNFLEKNEIPLHEVGTAFPNIGPREWYELNGQTDGFKEKDFGLDCFILYSNIMNDFSDEEIDTLVSSWPIVYQENKMGVCLIIYKNPKQGLCGN